MPQLQRTIAVDIVLLLPPRIATLALRYNRTLKAKGPTFIKLGQRKCFAHITLVMGCIPAVQLPALKRSLSNIARQHVPLRLTLISLKSSSYTAIDRIYVLNIARNKKLRALHEQAVAIIEPFAVSQASVSSLHPRAPHDPQAAEWARNFITAATHDNYLPHITVGIGHTKTKLSQPRTFTAARLGLCRIGHVGTCYKLLWQYNLKNSYT